MVDRRLGGVQVVVPDEHLDGHPPRADVVGRVGVGHRQLPCGQRIGGQAEHEPAVLGDDRGDLGAADVTGRRQLGLAGLGVVERGLRSKACSMRTRARVRNERRNGCPSRRRSRSVT